MSVKIEKGDALSNLSMTPLIDVVFLLIIFFLVATKFEEEEREMDVLLPEASEAMPLTSTPKEIFVNVDKDGTYYVAGKQLNEDGLLDVLREAADRNPGRQKVIIRADKQCVWQYVVAVMNQCNRAQIFDYTVSISEGG